MIECGLDRLGIRNGIVKSAGVDIDQLRESLARFVRERKWDHLRSPKNLAMALAVEATELLEHLRWLTEEESKELDPDALAGVAGEVVGVQIFLPMRAEKIRVDPLEATSDKIARSRERFPAAEVRKIAQANEGMTTE